MNDVTVGFIGLGLIGGSIAKAIRYFYPETKIIAHTRSRSTIDYALSEGIIDAACEGITPEFGSCDYIFLCAPVESNAAYLSQLKNLIKKDCILTDAGSTKTDIHEKVIALGMEDNFIGGHPMAGSEKTGIINAKRHLIENAYYILTPSATVPAEKVRKYQKFVSDLKAIPLVLNYEEHDFATAAISHLPHIIASTLVNLVKDSDTGNETMKTIAAGGFKDITRIASSSAEMWEQICMTNSSNILTVLNRYIESLNHVKAALTEKDSQDIYQLFDSSREYRDSISDSSSGPLKKVHMLYCDMVDEAGGIAALATILATNGISIKNIGIVHNREFEEAVLQVEFYEENALKKAVDLLRKYRYTVYER